MVFLVKKQQNKLNFYSLFSFYLFLDLEYSYRKEIPVLEKSTCFKMPSSISIATMCHVCYTNFVNRSSLIEHVRLEHGQSFDEENINEIANQQEQNFCGCSRSECKKVHEKEKLFHCEVW